MIFHLLIFIATASDVGGKQVLTDLKSERPAHRSFSSQGNVRATQPVQANHLSPQPTYEGGSLPSNLIRKRGTTVAASENPVIRAKEGVRSYAIQTNVGDIFDCRIYQDIIGYVGSVSPVRAEILEGPYKGYLFVGNATMDPKTKHLLVQFHKIRSPSGDAIVKVTATVHSSSGELGLKGTVTSNYWQYFFASVLASAAEGYAQATVQRQQSLIGFQNVPNTTTAGKVGVAEGASQTAQVMAENMKSAPEYTTVTGPIRTKIFIMDDVKL